MGSHRGNTTDAIRAEQELRHHAVQIVAMLPIDPQEAAAVLSYAQELVKFCSNDQPTRPARPVVIAFPTVD